MKFDEFSFESGYYCSHNSKILITNSENFIIIDTKIFSVAYRGISPRREPYLNCWSFEDFVVLATKSFVELVYLGDGSRLCPGIDTTDLKKIHELIYAGEINSLKSSEKFLEKLGLNEEGIQSVQKLVDSVKVQILADGTEHYVCYWEENPGTVFFFAP